MKTKSKPTTIYAFLIYRNCFLLDKVPAFLSGFSILHTIIPTGFMCLILKVSSLIIVTTNRIWDHVTSGRSCTFFQGLTLVTR